jgi:hypothetical protein
MATHHQIFFVKPDWKNTPSPLGAEVPNDKAVFRKELAGRTEAPHRFNS